ncbi:MAG: hypothetical protein IJP45_06105 [Paludibacteraceae bacterium]|nr:hypothetical protein [Paludibacteraceae bacterium]
MTYALRLACTTFCVMTMLCTLPARAEHYIGAAAALHSPLTLDLIDYTTNRISVGGEAGFVYEWHYTHLILHTGLHYAIHHPRLSLTDQQLVHPMVDTRNQPFEYHGSLRGRQDRILFGQAALPVKIGGVWKGMYGIIGTKLVMNLHARADIRAELQTQADYLGRYYDWFEEMPNHGYHDYEPTHSSHTMPLSPFDVRLAAEAGYMGKVREDARTQVGRLVRVGLFVEYGLMDMRDKNTLAPARTTPGFDQYMYVTMTHPYAIDETAGSAVHFLSFGLRLTVLFPIAEDRYSHRNCMCY